MKLSDFTLIVNILNPHYCYTYTKIRDGVKYNISTTNGGKTFTAIIESGNIVTSNTFDNIQECLNLFNNGK